MLGRFGSFLTTLYNVTTSAASAKMPPFGPWGRRAPSLLRDVTVPSPSVGDELAILPEGVVVKGSAGQGQFLRLFGQSAQDLRMAMALIHLRKITTNC